MNAVKKTNKVFSTNGRTLVNVFGHFNGYWIYPVYYFLFPKQWIQYTMINDNFDDDDDVFKTQDQDQWQKKLSFNRHQKSSC